MLMIKVQDLAEECSGLSSFLVDRGDDFVPDYDPLHRGGDEEIRGDSGGSHDG